MRSIVQHVQEILDRTEATGLPMTTLVEILERESITTSASRERLLDELRGHPNDFQIIDPRVGPWLRCLPQARSSRRGSDRERPGSNPEGRCRDGGTPWTPDVWVLDLRPRTRSDSPIRSRLSESLRSLGRALDVGSATATTRWSLLMIYEAATFPAQSVR